MAAAGVTVGAAMGAGAAVLNAGTGRSSGAGRRSASVVLGALATAGTSPPVVATGVFRTAAGTATSTGPVAVALTAVSRVTAIGAGSGAVTGAGGIEGVEATIDRAFALSPAAGRSGCGVVDAPALVEVGRVSAREGVLSIDAFAGEAGGSDTTAAASVEAIGRLAELSDGTSPGCAEASVSSELVEGALTGRGWLDGACATAVAGAF